MGMVKPERFGLYNIAETKGKMQLAVVISPDELNDVMDTVVAVPLLPVVTDVPFRILIQFKGKDGEIAMDKIISVKKDLLKQKVGVLPPELCEEMVAVLGEMFRI